MRAARRLGVAALVVLAMVRPGVAQPPSPTPVAAPTPEPTPPPTSAAETHDDIDVTTNLAPSPATVGDRVAYTVVITSPASIAVAAPVLTGVEESFEVAEPFVLLSEEVLADRVARTYRASLAPFEIGVRLVPAGEILARQGDSERVIPLPTIGVVVRSVLPAGTPPPLRGAKGVFALPNWLPPWLWPVLAALAVAGCIAWVLSRRRRGPAVSVAPPPLPYDEWARRELASLISGPLAESGRHKEFYVRLSEIVRTYLGEHHRFEAMEMTSDELKRTLKEKGISAEVRGLLWPLLDLTDLAKFARYEPPIADRDDAVSRATKLFARPRRDLVTAAEAVVGRSA